jgi:hypothetical protein
MMETKPLLQIPKHGHGQAQTRRPLFITEPAAFPSAMAHSEIHKWMVLGTICPVVAGGAGPNPTVEPGNNFTDRRWLTTHACTGNGINGL